MPYVLVQIALVVIVIRSVVALIRLGNQSNRDWLDVLFQASVAVVALHFLL
ncbi:hypothetical protein IDH44_14710 [Paenibacillus sp. IB182496]|uniref:Uncharacterized protein n=1 Tax=Paenibacillus sabuli TaxID=2772509 RepID=A0A927GSW1_9BACL|nr:hypothetical protein [Paenibacillus sabuli]MBD2846450.1 hypothetical protein [Paenibacillus sabuli]